MTACHHDEKKTDETTTTTTTDSTTVVAAPKPEEKEEPKKEEPKEHDKPAPTHVHHDSLKVDKGMPVIKDTAVLKEKPKDESSIGGATKKHVKPGGIKGHSN